MSKSTECRNSLFGILAFGRLVAAAPSYDRSRKKLGHVRVWRAYHFVFCTATCYLHYLSFSEPAVPKSNSSDFLLYVTGSSILRLTVGIAMLGLVFTSIRKWEEMLTHIVEIGEELDPCCDSGDRRCGRGIVSTLRHFGRFLPTISVAISEVAFPREPFWRWFLLSGIVVLQVNFLILIIGDVANIVEADFRLMNRTLIDNFIRGGRNPKAKTKRVEPSAIAAIYVKIYKTIDLFDDLFGWEIVLMNVLAVISSLPALEKIFSLQLDDARIVPEMLLAFWKIIACGMVTRGCHGAAKKGGKFGALLFEVSNRLPHLSTYDPARDEWRFLREMYDEFRPVFSAAGVFTIDYSVYYALFTLIMSYLAILMQFKSADDDGDG